MKYTTTQGAEIEVRPLPLTNRDGFVALRQVMLLADRAAELKSYDENAQKLEEELRAAVIALCGVLKVDAGAVAFPDLGSIISILQTGELPADPPRRETRPAT